MRLRDLLICVFCIVLAAALLITAGMQLDYINSERYRMKLISNEPLKNAPPSLAFATVAMGAFRGLVVDVLWIRADRLKEQGQFFDAKQLAEWITTLQPRFASVWEFHAWNMAYNISVTIPATQPDQRWRWVKNGYELLRDQGIPLNPKIIKLYRELAVIFQHKMGGFTDEAHKYYKLQLALAMEPLLGPADNKYFKALAEAPLQWRQVADDANVAPLIAALKSADKKFDDGDEDDFVSNYLSLRQKPSNFNAEAFRVIDDFRGSKGLYKLDLFAKAYHLRHVWKLDPVLMQELNQTYGPVNPDDPNTHLALDWRHPNTHAMYWSVKGLQIAGKKDYSIDETNTDRIVGHSLQNLFYNGKIFIYSSAAEASSSPRTREIFIRPDLRMFEPCNKARLAVLEKYKGLDKSSYVSIQNGHRNLLTNALLLFYQAGHLGQARNIYKQLRELYPREEFNVPLIQFARNTLIKDLKDIGLNDAKRIVLMLLRESYFRYAIREDDEAAGREKMAKEVYDYYYEKWEPENRIDLGDFKLLRYFALSDFLNDRQYPLDFRLALRTRIKLEMPKLAEQLERQEEELMRQLKQSK